MENMPEADILPSGTECQTIASMNDIAHYGTYLWMTKTEMLY